MKNDLTRQNTGNLAKKRRKMRRIAVATIILICAPILIFAMFVCGFYIWASGKHIDASLLPTASAAPVFYYADGEKIAGYDDDLLKADEISCDLQNAFVALEDKRFFKHKGYDVVRIAGAAVKNLKSGGVREGASTITQQLVKNTHLSGERTLSRKLNEIALAIDLEKKYSKSEILCMYLSVIYFGSGAYGVKDAARTFFDKSPAELTLAECATLAGIVKNPAGYSPKNHPEKCVERRNIVLALMREQGYISDEEFEAAKAAPLEIASKKRDETGLKAYIAMAREEICEELGITKYSLDNSGLKIYLNVDKNLQNALEAGRTGGNRESDDVSGASIILDNKSGAVLAYYSDIVGDIKRQTGSIIKPLAVYAPAFNEKLISLSTPVTDEKVNYGGYAPSNFNDAYLGDTDIRTAIEKSLNSVSLKVLNFLGVEKSAQYLEKFGIAISETDKNATLALGACSASPVDIAAAYGAIANGGRKLSPNFIRYALDPSGEKIYSQSASEERIISEAAAQLTSIALKDTAKSGTAKTLGALPFEVAAKTGTSERKDGKNSDAWCASFSDDMTILVWHGSDVGMTERGGGYPTREVKAIWQAVHALTPQRERMQISKDVVCADIDVASTKARKQIVLANENTPLEYRKTEYFDIENFPTCFDGLFDEASPVQFEIAAREGHVELSFDTMPIYGYSVYRTDVFGRALIYSNDGNGEKTLIKDVPFGFDKAVQYEVVCYLKTRPELSASSLKSVFFDMEFQ